MNINLLVSFLLCLISFQWACFVKSATEKKYSSLVEKFLYTGEFPLATFEASIAAQLKLHYQTKPFFAFLKDFIENRINDVIDNPEFQHIARSKITETVATLLALYQNST